MSSTSSHSNVVGVHYRVGKKIGEGSFGMLFQGVNLVNNQPIALKFESRKSEVPQLRDEYLTYKLLMGVHGVPNVYYYGQEGMYNLLVMDLLGPSLEDLFDYCGRRFSPKTVAMIAKQMITRIQSVHERHFIYRDIKPDNFLIGLHGSKVENLIYAVDFGMAKQYRDPKTHIHRPYNEHKSLSGTARYMSINTHLGREQSRRDDLESMGHVFMYFLRGSLPWQGLKAATNKQKYEKIGEKKQMTPIKDLCDGFPKEFMQYMLYVRNLSYDEKPDYDYLRNLFDSLLLRLNEIDDGKFDWTLINNGKGWQYSAAKQHAAHHRHAQDAAKRQAAVPQYTRSRNNAPQLSPKQLVVSPPYQSVQPMRNESNRHGRLGSSTAALQSQPRLPPSSSGGQQYGQFGAQSEHQRKSNELSQTYTPKSSSRKKFHLRLLSCCVAKPK
ncbi:CK1/CK1/CK1-G protein kinase Cki3 [Schizosaccharomyces octosporus yFS286]|uniref:non-specific serine/threonine protein kinase n=1 Tax=Schizosaccharomyces octosporus (strain yFS286) TaxID=483514 RepID=S9RAU6_SCHOY|nr:CK1/CK1/CK1-G protein kinase Cki3 [Schizosaccharomyces octosporus yFS286]EPX75260.1 CK1/CK1/CK1-G protein kinase Cki3 [Schizosaccharomyces octosporus yFS286]